MEIGFWADATLSGGYGSIRVEAPFGGPWFLGKEEISKARLSWALFADNAPASQDSTTMAQLGFHRSATQAVDYEPNSAAIRGSFTRMQL